MVVNHRDVSVTEASADIMMPLGSRLVTIQRAVEEHVAAFNAHDSSRVLAGFAADPVWTTGTDTFRGSAGVADVFDPWLWTLDPILEIQSLVSDDTCAAAQLHEKLTVDGERRSFDIAVFFVVKDGLIESAKVYREGSAALD